MSVERKILIEGVEHCWCVTQSQYFPCSKFFKSEVNPHGYHNSCKRCVTKNKVGERGEFWEENPRDLIVAHELLERMGYNTKSKIPIHLQFKHKFKL
jgi:hypothetical protein